LSDCFYIFDQEKYMKKTRIAFLVGFLILFFTVSLHAQDYHDYVVIVLDGSGSMNEPMYNVVNGTKVPMKYENGPRKGEVVTKINAAKEALYKAFKEIPDSTHVGVLVFSAIGVGSDWVYPIASKDEERLRRIMEKVSPSGGTPLGTYIKAAADALLKKREQQYNNGNYGLIVITDGEANNEPEWLVNSRLARELKHISYIDQIKSRGIKITAIGVSMDKNHTLANEVSYRSVNDPESFDKAVKEAVSEMSINDAATTFEGSGFDGDISGLSTEVALAIVQTISTPLNHPIGEKPKPKPAAVNPAPDSGIAAASPNATSASPAQAPASVAQPVDDDGEIILSFVLGGILGLVIIIFLIFFFGRRYY
jgi:hypothetical protein